MATRWVTEQQAARHVGRTAATLRGWRRDGFIDGHWHGRRRVVYNLYELEAVAAERRQAYEDRPKPGRPRRADTFSARAHA